MKGALPFMGCGARVGTISRKAGQNFQDSFGISGYSLASGAQTTNGLWTNLYTGGGSGVIVAAASGRAHIMGQQPLICTSGSGLDSYATLTVTNAVFQDFDMTIDVMTFSQTRTNWTAKTHEVGAVVWRYTDATHYYYFMQKPYGVEFGKQDGTQIFLKRPNVGQTDLTLDTWSIYRIRAEGSLHQIWKDGTLVVSHGDTGSSGATAAMAAGKIGLYTIDSRALYDNVDINSI